MPVTSLLTIIKSNCNQDTYSTIESTFAHLNFLVVSYSFSASG